MFLVCVLANSENFNLPFTTSWQRSLAENDGHTAMPAAN